MLSTLFYVAGFVFYIGRMAILANFKRYDYLTQNKIGKYIQIRTPLQSLWVYMWLFEMVWLLVGLLTDQWWAFGSYIIVRVLLSYLTHGRYDTRLIYYALISFGLLMLIVNHFHFLYKPAFLL